MGKITFVPVGGLANRMRAVASAVMLAGKTKRSGLFTGCFAVGLCIIRQTSFQEFSFPAFVSETAFQVLSVRAFHYSFM